jgi:hypothetical protein
MLAISPGSMRPIRELNRHRSGDHGNTALSGGIAVEAGDAHQSDVGRHVDD